MKSTASRILLGLAMFFVMLLGSSSSTFATGNPTSKIEDKTVVLADKVTIKVNDKFKSQEVKPGLSLIAKLLNEDTKDTISLNRWEAPLEKVLEADEKSMKATLEKNQLDAEFSDKVEGKLNEQKSISFRMTTRQKEDKEVVTYYFYKWVAVSPNETLRITYRRSPKVVTKDQEKADLEEASKLAQTVLDSWIK